MELDRSEPQETHLATRRTALARDKSNERQHRLSRLIALHNTSGGCSGRLGVALQMHVLRSTVGDCGVHVALPVEVVLDAFKEENGGQMSIGGPWIGQSVDKEHDSWNVTRGTRKKRDP